jgi:hypothetical protein
MMWDDLDWTTVKSITNPDISKNETAAEVHNGQQRNGLTVELYNSGSTCHISPFKERFKTLSTITPKSFTAANKQSFNAVGVIEIPNGVDVSKLCLTEVLYSPEVGYTLVSIRCLDELGYSATFADGKCTLCDSTEEIVGQIPRTSKGLYQVVHDASSGSIHAASETVMVMELHRCMGHIAPSAARRLAENGLVSGIKVDLSSGEPTFCELCVYAKAMQKPIRKTRKGDRATKFTEEIHTDLWGPTPVATIGE